MLYNFFGTLSRLLFPSSDSPSPSVSPTSTSPDSEPTVPASTSANNVPAEPASPSPTFHGASTDPSSKTPAESNTRARAPASLSTQVQAELASVTELLRSTSNPGLGLTLQHIRVDKAIVLLHQLESRTYSQDDLVHVRECLLTSQVSFSIPL